MSLLLPGTTLTILASHKLGHVRQCEGVARALGVDADVRPVRPRRLFRLFAPSGPPDWRDLRDRPGAALRKPWPDIALASGRETTPYLRAMKKLSGGRTFCIYIGDPRASRDVFDMIVLPEHDDHRGANVVTHLTPPHPRDEAAREGARKNPDPRIAALPSPRIALLLGGPGGSYRFERKDADAIAEIAHTALANGASLMVSPSRRTPAALVERLRDLATKAGARAFFWDGNGDNPYLAMLALADAFLITADSVNMIGEAVATGRPVYIYEPSGHAGKFTHFLGQLTARYAIRRFEGRFESWIYSPIDSTPLIAREIARRYREFIARRG